MVDTASTTAVPGAFEGSRPTHTNDLTIERQGMAPIPVSGRYGSPRRNFTVWFAPDVGVSGVFSGALAIILGLNSWQGIIAIVLGAALGTIPVAVLSTWGPKTGMGQLPVARLPFGKTIALPALVQWLSTISFDALQGLFGGEAAQLLFHVPFWVGLVIVLLGQGIVGFFGYEIIHQVEKWASLLALVFFVILSVKLGQHGQWVSVAKVHGADAVGMFIFMTTLAMSLTLSWASCACEYSRYLPQQTSARTVFASTFGGLFLGYTWVMVLGAAAGAALAADTAGGVRSVMGGGALGVFALVCMCIGSIAGNAMNDYSGSLALQAGGMRLSRPYVAAVVSVISFLVVLWLHTGDVAGKFENIALFASYWVAPFTAIVMVDWVARRGAPSAATLRSLMTFAKLSSGWPALVSLVVGFGVMVPFMNASLVEGPVATALHGGDIAIPVGFVVGGVLHAILRRFAPQQAELAAAAEVPVPAEVTD
jgi:nucleobase:cation symporter-1, NCS1 family